MIFADADVYCGIGTFAGDERPGVDNRSNFAPYGITLATADGSHALGVGAQRFAGKRLLVLQGPTGCRDQSWPVAAHCDQRSGPSGCPRRDRAAFSA